MENKRETLKSRLGFILISAGCAIGVGNVWKFPYVAGNNGGGLFVLFYLLFLAVVAVPVLTMEFAIGRASKKSIICAYQELEPKGTKWHFHGVIALLANYLLMMFYTTVAGWMLYYFYKFIVGDFTGLDTAGVMGEFTDMLGQPGIMTFWMILAIILGFITCACGLQKGVERITKVMMLALLGLIVVLAIHSVTLDGGMAGLKFYLAPNLDIIREKGWFEVIVAAMNQSFFTLSLGAGSMLIFGSYINKDNSLMKESLTVAGLDTFVALMSGLIIFPACFAFGVNPDSGPPLIFITLPNVFNAMTGGRIWGMLFFLFMSFAALSTVIAVFENIMSCIMDKWNMSRTKCAAINCVLLIVLSLPCVLGFNVWSGFQPLGEGSNILDLEDFIVSNLALPIGSIIYTVFCTTRYGWGFDNYLAEVNTGKGIKLHKCFKFYFRWILPILTAILLIQGVVATVAKVVS